MRSATFALFAGVLYLSIGLVGMIPEALSPAPAGVPAPRVTALYGYLLGLFPVNVVHSIVHIAIGAWGLAAFRRLNASKAYARGLAIIYGILAVLGFIPEANTLFGLVPLHGHDIWLHALTAAAAAYFGWRGEAEVERRGVAPDRRQRAQPVSRERRLGHDDRRAPGSEV